MRRLEAKDEAKILVYGMLEYTKDLLVAKKCAISACVSLKRETKDDFWDKVALEITK